MSTLRQVVEMFMYTFVLHMQESELTPTGANLLDGRYAVFGYTVEGSELLQELSTGDKIEYIKVLAGSQYLQQPKSDAAPSDFAAAA